MFTVIFQQPETMLLEKVDWEPFLHCLSFDNSSSNRLALYLTAEELHDLRDVLEAWNSSRSLAA